MRCMKGRAFVATMVILLMISLSAYLPLLIQDERFERRTTEWTKSRDPNQNEGYLESECSSNFHKTRSGGVTFTNVTPDVGLTGIRGDSFAWGDYNNDGFLDLLAKDHINGKSHLFKNNGPPAWDFSDVTEDAGLEGAGYAVWGDYNNDGFLDFFSVGQTNDDPDGAWDTLWMNQGPPYYTFTNMTGPAGNLNDGMPGLAAGWADYDRDNFLDLYVVNWRDLDDIRYPDVLYHNNGDGSFTDVTVDAGVWEGDDPYAGMGMNWGDYNNDGWPDIYVSNYLVTPNYLYENNQDGTFTEVAHDKSAAGLAPAGGYYGHTAGSSWCDYDHDGDLDMWVSNLAHTTDPRGFYTDYSQMLRNNGPPEYDFTDVRDETGIEKKPYMSEDELHFGIAWGDYDNDGDDDMFIPQVKDIDYAYSYFFENNGDGTFTDVSEDVGVRVWNTDGGCWADYNNDGYIDLITEGKEPFENGTYQVRLFRNNGESRYNWLEVEVKASESNYASIGARVKVNNDTVTQMKEIEGGTAGHAYQNSLIQHFGFGDYGGTVDVEVWWPSGQTRTLYDVSLNQKIVIREFDIDLELMGISFSNENPKEGDSVTITAKVKNVGNDQIDSATIYFIDEGESEYIGIKILQNIAPDCDRDAQIKWDTTDKEGIHNIIVTIGATEPGEEYYGNNFANKIMEVVKFIPDLTVSSILFSEEEPNEGETVSITAQILNIGNLKADSATIEIFDGDAGGESLGIKEIYDLQPDNFENVQIEYNTAGKSGSHTITVLIKDVLPEEENLGNNLESEKIEVKGYQIPSSPTPVNNPPQIIGFTADPTTVYSGGSVTLRVEAEDKDGDTLFYTYTVLAGLISGEGNTVIWHAPETEGTYEISVTVMDENDAEDRESLFIEVKGNAPPEIVNAIASSLFVKNNGIDRVLFTIVIEDENGLNDIEDVLIDLGSIGGSSNQRMYDDGSHGDSLADNGIYSFEAVIPKGLAPGEKSIEVTVEDKSGEETSKDIKITVLSTEEKKEEDSSILIFGFLFIFLLIIVILTICFYLRRGAKTRHY